MSRASSSQGTDVEGADSGFIWVQVLARGYADAKRDGG